MKETRPVNLNFTTIHFPITAIASISHRICGVISWIGLGFLLLILSFIFKSEENFNAFVDILASNFLLQFVSWGFLTAFSYYCVGCVKIFIQDFGFFEDLSGGKLITWIAIIATVLLSILSGVLVWG